MHRETYKIRGYRFAEGTEEEKVRLVVSLLSYGCPLQAIVHAFGLDERSEAAWQKRAGAHCQRVHIMWNLLSNDHEAVLQSGCKLILRSQSDHEAVLQSTFWLRSLLLLECRKRSPVIGELPHFIANLFLIFIRP